MTEKRQKLRRRLIFAGITAAVIILLYIWGFMLQTVNYKIKSDKIPNGLKIVFISDLHNCFFGGTDQSGLIEEIENAEPDIVIFGGDVVDQWGGTKYSLTLMKWAAENYRCFYTPGNHEGMRDDEESFIKEVKSLGISVPMGDYFELDIKNQPIRIYGVINAYKDNQLKDSFETLDNDFYNILIAHQPEQYGRYLDSGDVKFDLILSGHAHGGQWRVPFILEQGLYAPDQGLFPEYTNGMFDYNNGKSVHIISKGLAKPLRMIFIPRIFNRPEFTVIEIDS